MKATLLYTPKCGFQGSLSPGLPISYCEPTGKGAVIYRTFVFLLKSAAPIADILNRMAAVTMQQGVKLALHPEAFSMLRNSRDVELFMLLTDPTYVFLCPDTAQFVVAGSDPLAITRRHQERLLITHWKDATGPAPVDVPIDESIYDRQIQWFAPVGEGVVDWPGWLRLLRDLNFQGWAVLELDAAPEPVADLQRIKAFIERALTHIYR